MPKFFVPPENISGGFITINADNSVHIKRVLRMRCGESLTVSDGTGTDYECEITDMADGIVCKILDMTKNATEPNIRVTLYQALPKASKMEYIIQKTTELGIVKIVPCTLSRCVVKLDGKEAAKKTARWQKIAAEAAKQSGRGIIPEVAEVMSFDAALAALSRHGKAFVPYEGEKSGRLREVLTADKCEDIAFMIGPEGGFSPEEIAALRAAGIASVTLGPRILRTETAGEATLAMIMYEVGDIN